MLNDGLRKCTAPACVGKEIRYTPDAIDVFLDNSGPESAQPNTSQKLLEIAGRVFGFDPLAPTHSVGAVQRRNPN